METQDVFRKNVKEISELNETIKNTKDLLKQLNSRKKDLESNIKTFMSTNQVQQAVTKKNRIVLTRSKRVVPLKKKDQAQNFAEFFQHINWEQFTRTTPEEKARQLIDFLNNKRTYTINESISYKKV